MPQQGEVKSPIFLSPTPILIIGGGVADLKAATGAIVYGYGAHPSCPGEAAPMLDEGSDFSYAPDEILRDGDTISTDEWSLNALHTPGHISNHLCYELAEEKALFTGDHMMGLGHHSCRSARWQYGGLSGQS